MASTNETMDITNEDASPSSSQEVDNTEPPSGFILKLYQMVNGAPDEVISWTPSGDAFIIGSNVKRLESETLPQYFRHNRFQSLVRQLNFYSFRKVNRERNVWIYQHSLFHRDRPQDLHLVRRRTCPGLDGRKQRFSRFTARRLSQSESDGKSDESSVEEPIEEESLENTSRKRESDQSYVSPPSSVNKRSRTKPLGKEILREKDENEKEIEAHVDLSMLQAPPPSDEFEPVTSATEIVRLTDPSEDRVDFKEQAMIVSEVAMKLEEHAKKAMRGRRGKTRRSGVVTPPYSTAHGTSLLTYDDEYNFESDDLGFEHRASMINAGVVTDGSDDSSEDLSTRTPAAARKKSKPPVPEEEKVVEIIEAMIEYVRNSGEIGDDVLISLANFCMSTSPMDDLGPKITKLLVLHDDVSDEFQMYRTALYPGKQIAISYQGAKCVSPDGSSPASNPEGLLEKGANFCVALRDFKTFAVNYLLKIIRRHESSMYNGLTREHQAWIEHTLTVWQRSV